LRKIKIAIIALITQTNNIQNIYYGVNTTFVENGVVMILSIIYVKAIIETIKNVKPCEDKNNGRFKCAKVENIKKNESKLFILYVSKII
jgi:hypothetical protein